MLSSFRTKHYKNEKHKQIMESLNDLDNFNIDFSILSRTDDPNDSNTIKTNSPDSQILKKNILFKHWTNETFNKLIEEKHICMRKMK